MVDNTKKNLKNRRQLLRSVLRYTTLGLLGVSGGTSFIKRQRLRREGKCVNGGICRTCGVFDSCGRPAALSAKKVMGTELNG